MVALLGRAAVQGDVIQRFWNVLRNQLLQTRIALEITNARLQRDRSTGQQSALEHVLNGIPDLVLLRDLKPALPLHSHVLRTGCVQLDVLKLAQTREDLHTFLELERVTSQLNTKFIFGDVTAKLSYFGSLATQKIACEYHLAASNIALEVLAPASERHRTNGAHGREEQLTLEVKFLMLFTSWLKVLDQLERNIVYISRPLLLVWELEHIVLMLVDTIPLSVAKAIMSHKRAWNVQWSFLYF